MKCEKANKMISERIDSLLPEIISRQVDHHIEGCVHCAHDMKVLTDIKPLLKGIYKEIGAPAGFSSRVMSKVKTSRRSGVYGWPSLFVADFLRPAAVLAVSAAIIVSMFANDLLTADKVTNIPPNGEMIHTNGDKPDEPVIAEETETIKEAVSEPIVQDDALEPGAIIKETDDPNEQTDATVAQNGYAENEDILAVTDVFNNNFNNAELVSPLKEVSTVENKKTDENKTIGHDLVPAKEEPVANFAELSLPDPSIFEKRRRVVESTSISIAVQEIEKSFQQLKQRAEHFGFTHDITEAFLREDGTITVMISYRVPTGMANLFAVHVSAFGTVIERSNNRLDLTSEYLQLLSQHKTLVEEAFKSNNRNDELIALVAKLTILDQRSKPGYENLVIWLEEVVDF